MKYHFFVIHVASRTHTLIIYNIFDAIKISGVQYTDFHFRGVRSTVEDLGSSMSNALSIDGW